MPAKAINLLIRKDFDQTSFGRFLRWSLTYGRYIIICTEIIVLLAFIYRFSLDRSITDLNENIDQKSAIVKANQGFEKRFRNLQTRSQQVSSLFNHQGMVIYVLNHLEQITPSQVQYSSLDFSGDAISIAASTNANAAR